jgi:hypothetical protein
MTAPTDGPIGVPALQFLCDSPPEPFEDEFPMIGGFLLLEHDNEPIMYIPEDDEVITDTKKALQYIMVLAPLMHFNGGTQVVLNITEDG